MSGHLDLRWGRCRYRQTGDGPAIVLVHGWSCSLHTWDDVVPALVEAGFTVVDYDVRGHGGSGWDGQDVSMSGLVADLREIVDRLGVRSPVLCGHSLGGMIALEYSLTYPDDVAGLALASTGVRQRPDDAELAKVLCDHDNAVWWPIFEAALYSPTHRAGAARERFLALDLTALQAVMRAVVTRADLTDRLPELAVPTTVVVGENDPIWTVDAHVGLADRIPGADLVVIPGAGHMLPEEAPAELAEVLIRPSY